MDELRIIEVKKSVYANNDKEASENRDLLKKQGTFMMNLMSSPGSGKTTMLVSTLNRLKEHVDIGTIEADIDSDVDATYPYHSGNERKRIKRILYRHRGPRRPGARTRG